MFFYGIYKHTTIQKTQNLTCYNEFKRQFLRMAKQIIKLTNKGTTVANEKRSKVGCLDTAGFTYSEEFPIILYTSPKLIDGIKQAIKDESKIMLDKNK